MNEPEFKIALRERLRQTVAPLISNEAVYWDVPYHSNIGDSLIWQGISDMLHSLHVKVNNIRGCHTCNFPSLSPATTIILHGGGNFGTLYPMHQTFRREVLRRYPDNPVIVMPQSVFYDDTPPAHETLRLDRQAYAAHPRVTICARDRASYDFMRANFPASNVLLAPDAAFAIDDRRLEPYRNMQPTADTMFMRRLDKEITPEAADPALAALPTRDWYHTPTIARRIANKADYWWWRLHHSRFQGRWPESIGKRLLAAYYNHIMLPDALCAGCTLIAPFRRVVTTRLHGMILALMLGREVEYIDNRTGKLSAYASTWGLPARQFTHF